MSDINNYMSTLYDSITVNQILKTFEEATSVYDMCGKLGIPQNGTGQRFVNKFLDQLSLDKTTFKKRRYDLTHIKKECPVCGKEFFLQRGEKDKTTCSHRCANTYFHSGDGNGRRMKTIRERIQAGKKISSDSYRSICFEKYDKKCVVCGEEKIVAVHHLDGNHCNNSIENLVPLCPTHHVYVHSKYKNEIMPIILDYINKRLDNKMSV